MSDNEENLVEHDYEGEMKAKMSEEEDNEENLVERDYEGEKRIKINELTKEELNKMLDDMEATMNEKFEKVNLHFKEGQDMLDKLLAIFE